MARSISKWLAGRRAAREDSAIFQAVFDDVGGAPGAETIRGWSDEELHERLTTNSMWATSKSMAESELRRREAWKGPGAWSVRISIAALVVSIIALGFSLYR